jgi:hypothetical protein
MPASRTTAPSGQTRQQTRQSVQVKGSITAIFCLMRTAPTGQSRTQKPQLLHFSISTRIMSTQVRLKFAFIGLTIEY